MLDQIPAWARHLAIVIGTTALTFISQALVAGGIDKVDWKACLNAVIAAAVAYLLLVATPLTQQYGVGAPPPPGQPVIADPPPDPQVP